MVATSWASRSTGLRFHAGQNAREALRMTASKTTSVRDKAVLNTRAMWKPGRQVARPIRGETSSGGRAAGDDLREPGVIGKCWPPRRQRAHNDGLDPTSSTWQPVGR